MDERGGKRNQESRNSRTIEALPLFPRVPFSALYWFIHQKWFGRIVEREHLISNYVLCFLVFSRDSFLQSHYRIQAVWAYLIVSIVIIVHKMLCLFLIFHPLLNRVTVSYLQNSFALWCINMLSLNDRFTEHWVGSEIKKQERNNEISDEIQN